MTTPTQAQIRAAAEVLRDLEERNWETMAKAALTAAAKVSEEGVVDYVLDANWKEITRLKAELNATIERCAQVAESYEHLAKTINMPLDAIGVSDTIKYIAAAIRALKDNSHGDGWIVDDAKPAIDPNLVYPGKDPDFVFPEET